MLCVDSEPPFTPVHQDVCKLLLRWGSDLLQRNTNNETASEIAKRKKNEAAFAEVMQRHRKY